ncbi:MAG: Holliday junction DNA helicase RuvA [Elusimicrobia bacterium RIFOXYB2_FULL_49_7]|nr:MAG: Holliday junction DNA helicase RuvA [Elusimicrobia bacterium RIFOXYB2_FULL_49_7]
MIERIKGILLEKEPTHLVVDVQGVGYGLHVSLNTSATVAEAGSETTLFTYLHVREEAMVLFGFSREIERDLFLLLLSVSKIGPKSALAILSGMSVENLVQAIRGENVAALTKISGIGKQSAERLVVELKNKIAKFEQSIAVGTPGSGRTSFTKQADEAVNALESLGYKRFFAEKAVAKVLEEQGSELPVEQLIKSALKYV